MRNTLKQIRAHVASSTPLAAMEALGGKLRFGVFVGRLGIHILKQWARDRCPQQAAALTFQTTLSLVPVLALALSGLRAMDATDAESRLMDFLSRQVFPDSRVATYLSEFSGRVAVGATGASGLIFTLLTCFALYGSVERIWSDIWHATRRRSWLGRFLTFYALVTLVPVLASMSLYWTGRLLGRSGFLQFVVPLALQFMALLLMNKLLPTTKVTWRAALLGTAVTAVALESLKLVFFGFAKRILLDNYSGVYGPLGIMPLVLVWMYASWLLVLLGAEIGSAIQNLRQIEAEERRRAGEEPVNGLVALQLLDELAADLREGGKGLRRDDLVTLLGVTPHGIDALCARLKARGFVAEVTGDKEGFILGRAPESIRIEDVMAAFRATDLEAAPGETSPKLAALIDDLETSRRARIAGVTLADLASPPSSPSRLAGRESA